MEQEFIQEKHLEVNDFYLEAKEITLQQHRNMINLNEKDGLQLILKTV